MEIQEIYKEFYETPYDNNGELLNTTIIKSRIKHVKFPKMDNEFINKLIRYNENVGSMEKTIENINYLKEGALAVVTGHQPTFMTGSLFTIYKAITVIKLSNLLEKQLGLKIVPIFWIASHDHDLDEVRKVKLLDIKNEIKDLKLDIIWSKLPVGDIPIYDEAKIKVAEFFEKLKGTEFTNTIKDSIEKCLNKDDTFSSFFAKLMNNLFGDRGLVFFDPLKVDSNRSLWIYKSTLDNWTEINVEIKKKGELISAQGYTPPLNNTKGNPLLFIEENSRREQIYLELDGVFKTKNNTYSKEELLEAWEKLSPNVAIRPILQDALLPSIAYIGGPSELLYLYQIEGIYKYFDMVKPMILPRISSTIIETPIDRLMKEEGYDYIEFKRQGENYLDFLIQDGKVKLLEAKIDTIKTKINQEYKELIKEAINFDSQLEPILEKNLQMLISQIDYIDKRINDSWKRKNDIIINRFKRVYNSLFPEKNSQERVYNIYQYLNKYGGDLIETLLRRLQLTVDQQIIYLGSDSNED